MFARPNSIESPGREPPRGISSPAVDKTPEQRLDILSFLVRLESKTFDMAFLPSDGGWAVSVSDAANRAIEQFLLGDLQSLDGFPEDFFRVRNFVFSEKDLETLSEAEFFGLAEHELGHCLHTSFRLCAEGQRAAIDEGFMATTWAEIHNACEDPRVNILRAAASPTAGRAINEIYERRTDDIDLAVNRQSLTRQLGLNIIYYWYAAEPLPNQADPRVKEALDALRPALDRFFYERDAAKSVALFHREIWPIARSFEALALHEEEVRALTRAMVPEGFEAKATPILARVLRTLSWRRSNDPAELAKAVAGALMPNMQPGFLGQLRSELAQQQERQERENSIIQSRRPGVAPRMEIELSTMPTGMREEIERLLDRLPARLRKRILELGAEAQQERSAKDAKDSGTSGCRINTRKDGKKVSLPDRSPTRREKKRREERLQQVEESKRKSRAAPDPKDVKGPKLSELMQKEGFAENEADLFAQFVALEASAGETIRGTLSLFEALTRPESDIGDPEDGYYLGTGLAMKELGRRIPVGDLRIATRREETESTVRTTMNLVLGFDNSISMEGAKSEAVRKLGVIFGRVATLRGDRLSMVAFDGSTHTIKKGEDDYDDPRSRIKPSLMLYTRGDGLGTNIEAALKSSRELLALETFEPTSIPIIFLLSDGTANQGLTGNSLRAVVTTHRENALIFNFQLCGSEAELAEAKKIFGVEYVVDVQKLEDLFEEAGRMLLTIQRSLEEREYL